jgi:hypothetical protein
VLGDEGAAKNPTEAQRWIRSTFHLFGYTTTTENAGARVTNDSPLNIMA